MTITYYYSSGGPAEVRQSLGTSNHLEALEAFVGFIIGDSYSVDGEFYQNADDAIAIPYEGRLEISFE